MTWVLTKIIHDIELYHMHYQTEEDAIKYAGFNTEQEQYLLREMPTTAMDHAIMQKAQDNNWQLICWTNYEFKHPEDWYLSRTVVRHRDDLYATHLFNYHTGFQNGAYNPTLPQALSRVFV